MEAAEAIDLKGLIGAVFIEYGDGNMLRLLFEVTRPLFEVTLVVMVEHPTEEEVPLAFFEGCLRLLAEDEIRLLSSLSSLL